ncbi:MAG: hypothetical protein LUF68_03220 [Clostridiales bacterium]|nr:hypothetical protein [Clostridiales bacterium]
MEYLVAVSSSDGAMVDTHFGRTREFLIFKVTDNTYFDHTGTRQIPSPCFGGGHHDNARLASAVEALADCRYVLCAQIGPGAQTALRSSGITPLDVVHRIDYALEKLMLYDKKFKHDKHERE